MDKQLLGITINLSTDVQSDELHTWIFSARQYWGGKGINKMKTSSQTF